MNIYSLLSFFVVTAILTTSAQAVIQNFSVDWDRSTTGDYAFVAYKQPYEDVQRSIEISISHSKVGEQRLYITTLVLDNSTKCNVYMLPTPVTMTFNGQAVKMTKYCHEYTDSDTNYYSYTPTTDKGHTFVVNLFKTSTTPIKLNFEGNNLYIPVKGFTRAWNSAGGNAI